MSDHELIDFSSFPLEDLLRANHVEFRIQSRKAINIRCPFCSDGDSGFHCGVFHGVRRNFSCFRCGERGTFYRLLSRLFGMSPEEVDSRAKLHITDDVVNQIKAVFSKPESDTKSTRSVVTLPSESLPLSGALIESTPTLRDFLRSRRFPVSMYREKGVKYCATGKYAGRIIIPIYQGKSLRAFQGRLVFESSQYPKYLTSEGAVLEDTLYGYDDFSGPTLIVVEGVFDVWALPGTSVAVFKSAISANQASLMLKLKPRRIVLAFDPDVWRVSAKVASIRESVGLLKLLVPDVRVARFPEGEDPGSLGPRAMDFVREAKDAYVI